MSRDIRACVWRDSFACVTWLIHVCDVTHSYVWRDSFVRVTWLIHMCDVTHSYVCDVSHSYVWCDSFICATCLIHMCDVTHSYVWRDSFICVRVKWSVPWKVLEDGSQTRNQDLPHVWRDSFVCVTCRIHTCDRTDVTYSYVWHESYCARDMIGNIYGSFGNIYGSFGNIYGSFGNIYGSFVDIHRALVCTLLIWRRETDQKYVMSYMQNVSKTWHTCK